MSAHGVGQSQEKTTSNGDDASAKRCMDTVKMFMPLRWQALQRDGGCCQCSALSRSKEVVSTPAAPPGRPTVLAALGINALIFALWQLERRKGGPRWLLSFLNRHTLCSRMHLRRGRIHTLLTSSASHQAPLHFAVNAYGLGLFGGLAAEKLSSQELSMALGVCGAGASMCHVLCHPSNPVLGASGALMGLVTVAGFLEPERRFFMILPVPGLTFSMLQVADLAFAANFIGFFFLRHWLGSVAWAAHLGGTASGLGFAFGAHLHGDKRFADPLHLHSAHCAGDWQCTAESAEAGVARLSDVAERFFR